MKILAVGNHKGGLGKTTTVLHLGAALAAAGERVLLVDLDGQDSLAPSLGVTVPPGHPTVAEILDGPRRPAAEAILPARPGLDLIAAGPDLAALLVSLPASPDRPWQGVLARALAPLADRYDRVIIDMTPSLSSLAIVALVAADDVLIPTHLEPSSWRQTADFLDSIERLRTGTPALNPRLRVIGVLPTFVDLRSGRPATRLAAGIDAALRSAGIPVLDPPIRRTTALAEATLARQTIFEWDPENPAAAAYRHIAEEVQRAAQA